MTSHRGDGGVSHSGASGGDGSMIKAARPGVQFRLACSTSYDSEFGRWNGDRPVADIGYSGISGRTARPARRSGLGARRARRLSGCGGRSVAVFLVLRSARACTVQPRVTDDHIRDTSRSPARPQHAEGGHMASAHGTQPWSILHPLMSWRVVDTKVLDLVH